MIKLIGIIGAIVLVLMWIGVYFAKIAIKKADQEKLDVIEKLIENSEISHKRYDWINKQFDNVKYRGARYSALWFYFEEKFKKVSDYKI